MSDRKEYKQKWYQDNKDKVDSRSRSYQKEHVEELKEYQRDYGKTNPLVSMLSKAKNRASSRGIEFSITQNDIFIPEFCPYFGIPLFKGEGTHTENSPSIDRIDSSKGYIPGNVEVISRRANVIKNNGTADEHMLIAQRMKTLMAT
jgi:hypothetical protein